MIGVVGTGELGDEEVEASFNDLFQTAKIESVEVIFALTDDAVGDGLWSAYEYVALNAKAGELSAAAVTYADGNTEDKGLHGDAEDKKVRIIPIGDQAAVTVADELIKAKAAGAETVLVAFWVPEDPNDLDADPGAQYAALETAIQGGVEAYNICKAMDPLFLGDEGDAEKPAAEPEAPARTRRSRTAAPPADEAPAAETKEEAPPRRRRGAAKAADTPPAGADEAQNTPAVLEGSIWKQFVREVAECILAILDERTAGGAKEEAAPARRSRRS